ncbi:redoxin domain-containing protein [Histidinibacterium aquaticum]|uniref:Alkyl hydroperoxide reductase C n=1 Tax=Histidinibacterium aquaticum TaxID=2613962 RepID=A0A5J5GJA5_9RHOB|nr:redoxin domain-containing protein [Histidinibacterium aquaticum]KAA9007823.1 redoxin domain-containing protein [Histidinibacterium aquaticum]
MSVQFFSGSSRHGGRIKLPMSYRRTAKWLPQIGDIFPDFTTRSTKGKIDFHEWAEGSWVVLFSHPAAFTPVCTTEIAGFALAEPDFQQRNTKLISMSRSALHVQKHWLKDIESLFGIQVGFPMLEDETGHFSKTFGMIHPHENDQHSIRKTFIIDPALKVRMIMEYPLFVGRGTDEILRVIDALQVQDEFSVGVGGDWQKGSQCLALPGSMQALSEAGHKLTSYRYYLTTVDLNTEPPEDEG